MTFAWGFALLASCGARTGLEFDTTDTDTDSDSVTDDCADVDGDGHRDDACGGDDCDDDAVEIHPGAPDPIVASWASETIDANGASNVSLVMDDDDIAHVGYVDQFGDVVRYATNTFGPWGSEATAPTFGDAVSIAIDSSRIPSLALTGSSGRLVVVRREAADRWNRTDVSSARWRTVPSLVIDADDAASVCFVSDWEGGFPELRRATRAAGSEDWVIQSLVSQVSVGKDWETPTCDFDADGGQLAFTNGAAGSVGYGQRDGDGWLVSDLVEGGGSAVIGVDRNGVPSIFYRSAADAAMHVVWGGEEPGWTDAIADAGAVRLIAAADAAQVQVAWVTDALRWGTWDGKTLVSEDLPAPALDVTALALAVGDEGQPRIALQATNDGLVYLRREVDGDGIDQDCDGVDG